MCKCAQPYNTFQIMTMIPIKQPHHQIALDLHQSFWPSPPYFSHDSSQPELQEFFLVYFHQFNSSILCFKTNIHKSSVPCVPSSFFPAVFPFLPEATKFIVCFHLFPLHPALPGIPRFFARGLFQLEAKAGFDLAGFAGAASEG